MQSLNASLLAAFMAGDERSAEQFKILATPHILAFARRFGKGLPVDVIGEIASETFAVLLAGAGHNFDQARGGANVRTFLFGVVRTGAQRVRASYAQPGHRTRYYKDAPMERTILSFDELEQEPANKSAEQELGAVEASHDVEVLLGHAPATLAIALVAIYLHNRKVKDVARELGVSRFSLHRDIEAFRRDYCRRPARRKTAPVELAA